MKLQPGNPSLVSSHWWEINSGVIVKKNAAMKSARHRRSVGAQHA